MCSIAKRLDVHFVACAAAAGAAVVGTAQQSEAAIVWSGAVNINIPSTTAGVYLNVVTGVSNVSPSLAPGWDVNPWNTTGLGLFNPTAPAGGVYVATTAGGTTAVNMAFGATIDGTSLFGSNSAPNGAWNLNSSNNLVGFRLQDETSGNAIRYGWMRISLGATAGGQPRAIVEYAYENTGAGIGAGVVPAPGSVALLAVGALGLAGRRRK